MKSRRDLGAGGDGLEAVVVIDARAFASAQHDVRLLYVALACSGLFLGCYLGCSGFLWPVLACSGLLWAALDCSGLLWTALGCSGLLWAALGWSGLLWDLCLTCV